MSIGDFFTREQYSDIELKLIIEAIPANVFYKDTQCRYQLASHVCRMLNGEGDNYTIIGKTDREVQVEKELGRQYYEEDLDIVANGGSKKYISEMRFGGETYYYEISKQAMRDTEGSISGIVGMVTDITELIKLQKELEWLSTRDTLTGCFNRTFLERRKTEGLVEADLPFTVIMSDCNGLKRVNDTFGHTAGDEYIRRTVDIILGVVSPKCDIFRLGGDEFLTLVPNCDEEARELLISRLHAAENGQQVSGVPVSSSFGAATIRSIHEGLSSAMGRADADMYQEKKRFHETSK